MLSPEVTKAALESKALVAEGRFVAALVVQMERMRLKADGYLASEGLEITYAPEFKFTSLAHEYAVRTLALADYIATQPEEKTLYLVGAHHIYMSLGTILEHLGRPGVVDAERIAAIILAGMDLSHVDTFCDRIDPETLDEQVRMESFAQAYVDQHTKGAKAAAAVRSVWHEPALVGAAVSRHYNPDASNKALREKIFGFLDTHLGHEFTKDDGLEKVLQRKRARVEVLAKQFRAYTSGERVVIPESTKALFEKAVQHIAPQHYKAFTGGRPVT